MINLERYHLKKEDDPFQYEIDALAASDPVRFKKMILDEVDQFYDKNIYDRLLSYSSHSEEQICTQVIKNVQRFLPEYNIRLFMESNF